VSAALDRVLETARSQLGYVEGTGNRTKYGQAYGMDGVAWCAQFCWWVFREAQVPLGFKSAYTPTIADWFRSHGQWGMTPRAGALVLFDFPGDGVNRISHIGIVEAVNRDGSIVTIEGNTSGTAAGSQRNGGMVARKTRKVGIVGYGYPSYPPDAAGSSSSPATPAAPAPRRPAPPEDEMYIKCQLRPAPAPAAVAILSGPIFVGLGSPGEMKSADEQIARGAVVQWVEAWTWNELDKRSHALCDNPRPVIATAPSEAHAS
jgi:hypothetical protein